MIHLCGVHPLKSCALNITAKLRISHTLLAVYSNSNMSRGSSSLVRSLQTDKYYSYGLYIGPPHAMMKRIDTCV